MDKDYAMKLSIQTALGAFATESLRTSALGLFATLGYQSDRTLPTGSVDAFCKAFDANDVLDQPAAFKSNWLQVELLFQLTDEELGHTASLFKETAVSQSRNQSYVFFAIELDTLNGKTEYTRSQLAGITRRLNRVFPMPVMVLYKMGKGAAAKVSIAVINRRAHKRDNDRDVLGKVTLIQNIHTAQPHRGHVDILASFALPTLKQTRVVDNFDTLHAAWEAVFNVELLNKRFYEELANWYFWARTQVTFPEDLEPHDDTRNSTSVIRLLTRLIFCWFLKEKNLIPNTLFSPTHLRTVMHNLDEASTTDSSYYRAILQNLFFATLNQEMNADGKMVRQFAAEGGLHTNRDQYGIKTLYRYSSAFQSESAALALFEDVPFLNGGLFACLDVTDDAGKVQYADGFSRNVTKQPVVPNHLFFAEPHFADLSVAYNDAKKKKAPVRGLIHILQDYKFTIAESTPVEQEIALDPELLGNVFENLLASYNPETGESARKQTGSFYTPRPIVDYMVDETLKAYLAHALCDAQPKVTLQDAQIGLDVLFAYTERIHPFTQPETAVLIDAIHRCNILDPACGSGAYPMGILHKLVFILSKLDPQNELWMQKQIATVDVLIDGAYNIDDAEHRDRLIANLDERKAGIKADFYNHNLDYGRKLYLIQECIFGVDIQPIAIQIAKLRFFISLVCDQRTNEDKSKNRGVRALPNLEIKFVAANTLISISKPETAALTQSLFENLDINRLERELEIVRSDYFSAQTRKRKEELRLKDKKIISAIKAILSKDASTIDFVNKEVMQAVLWNPYDQHKSADFFDSVKMFGSSLKDGFDVVIGNPPYIGQKGHKEIFRKILPTPLGKRFHQGKMDLFYFFFHLALDVLKNGGHCAYITTNYFITATYADKLRLDLKNRATILKLTNFNELKIFESAAGQHNAVTFFRKGVSANQVTETAVTSKTGIATESILRDIIAGEDADTQYRLVKQPDLYEGSQNYIRMVSNEVSESDPIMAILGKVALCGTPLEKIAQANQGIITGCDKIIPKHLSTYQIKAQKGDGIFVLTQNELKNLSLTPNELGFVRPWFKNSNVGRFYCSREVDTRLIYLSSKNFDKPIPNIKKHLTRFKEILINRENRAGIMSLAQYDAIVKGEQSATHLKFSPAMMRGDFFSLFRSRKEEIFEGPKIVAPQRSYRNTFGYNEVPWYASADVYFITNPSPNVSLKFVLALLNSKLYFAWLYYKGKRKGAMMELYQKPLSEIPFKVVSHQEQMPFIALVDKILTAKELYADADTSALENEIDMLVYALYDLSSVEIKHVENALPKPRNQTADAKDDEFE
jgi:adenine-specific DNA-methyltransferase